MAHDVQKPVFAGAYGSQGDDFDLNEIFADYFISEFEDPMNAYTSSMANYGGGATAVAMGQQVAGTSAAAAGTAGAPGVAAAATAAAPPQQVPIQPGVLPGQEQLPTGGIKTAFHAAAAAVATPATQTIHHYQHAAAVPPQTKKQKLEPHPGTLVAPRPGGLTSRLGTMPLIQAQNGAQVAAAPGSQLSCNPGVSGISLPVGVGIRLGGAGGVAPNTAQNAARGPGFNMWGGPQAGGVPDQAIAERRQRNREHAKRSRVRKKFMLESLQEQVASLQLENQRLRTLVQDNIPEHAQKIIAECCTSSTLFADSSGKRQNGNAAAAAPSPTTNTEEKDDKSTALVKSDFQLMESLSSGQQNFVLSDPRLPDNPIVFATPGFYKLTGYTQEQVLGRNCRFLQGPGTNPKTVDIIRKAIATGADCTVCILNYKADGTPFWNQFFVAALRDSDNCIVNYVGVQTEVEPDAGANALEDRVNAVLPLQNKDDEKEEEE